MSIIEFFSELRRSDIKITLDGEKLKINAPKGALTNDIKLQLKARKQEIIDFLSQSDEETSQSIQVRGDDAPLIASFSQRSLWFLDQLNPGNTGYNMPLALKLKGKLDLDTFNRVITELFRRHNALRTNFLEGADAEPTIVIQEPQNWTAAVEDISHLPAEDQEAAVKDSVRAEGLTPFNLAQDALLRLRLIKLNSGDELTETVLVGCIHHIVSDGWSNGLLMKEIATLYTAFVQGAESSLPELAVQYEDFAAWQRNFLSGDTLAQKLGFWREFLKDAPSVSTFPSDFARPEEQSNRGAKLNFEFPEGLFEKVDQLSQGQGNTLFMTLLGGFQLLLARYARQEDVCIGIPVAGRKQLETHDVIGFFVNALTTRLSTAGNPTVSELLKLVKESTLGAFANEEVPLNLILDELNVERSLSHNPLAQVGFQLQNFGESTDAAVPADQQQAVTDLELEPLASDEIGSKYDLIFSVAQHGNVLSGYVEYNTDLYRGETISTLVDKYFYLLDWMFANVNANINRLELASREELHEVLHIDPSLCSLQRLTSTQRSIFLDTVINPEVARNSIGSRTLIHADVDRNLIEKALQYLSDQYSSLRATGVTCDLPYADDAYLVIAHEKKIELQFQDLSEFQLNDDDAIVYAEGQARIFYPVEGGALVSYHLYKIRENCFVLLCATHHMISDGVGLSHHFNQLIEIYRSLSAGEGITLSVVDNYAEQVANDVAVTGNGAATAAWAEKLADVEALDFSNPDDFPQPLTHPLVPAAISQEAAANIAGFHQPQVDFEEVRCKQALPDAVQAAVEQYCQAENVSIPRFFKSIFSLLLVDYCRPQQDFTLLEMHGGRTAEHEATFGCYYQQVPFLYPHELQMGETQFSAIYKHTSDYRRWVHDKRVVPISQQRQMIPQSRVTALYNFFNFQQNFDFNNGSAYLDIVTPMMANTIQLICKWEAGQLVLDLRYDKAIFNDLGFVDRAIRLAHQIAEKKVTSVAEISLLAANDEQQLDEWVSNADQPQSQLASSDNLVSLLEKQVEKTPNNVALQYGDEKLTYLEMNSRANQLARLMQQKGVNKGDIVGVCLDRSLDMLVALVATIKAGAAYVPMDVNYPVERLNYLLGDSQASLLVTEQCMAEKLPQTLSAQVLYVDSIADELSKQDKGNLNLEVQGEDLLYVIYTSGSTGQPKGAGVKHIGEVNLLQWYTETYDMSEQDATLVISAFGFDLTQKNHFALLTVGGCVVIPKMDHYDDQVIADTIARAKISLLNCAPSAFYPLVENSDASSGFEQLASLRFLFLGGEPIRMAALYPWLSSSQTQCQLVNSYGPTECTDVVAFHTLEKAQPDQTTIPIGKPIGRTQLYILNNQHKRVPVGLVGELCIAGQGVGVGYLNRDELTAAAFIDNAFGEGKLYKTGDLARYRADGSIEYIGRKDFQIKLRGLRIELGEIEFALKQLSGVVDGLVLLKQDTLVAYVVVTEGFNEQSWRQHLTDHLPEYMVPSHLVALDQWPLTPNGKIDRKALPDPDASGLSTEYVAPRNEIERNIASIWSDVLKRDKIGVHDNFFELGGHSLLATQIASRARAVFKLNIELRRLFSGPTVAEVSAHIAELMGQGGAELQELQVTDRSQPLPLSFAQQRMWFMDQLQPGSTAYNIPLVVRVKGALDRDALRMAFAEIAHRHESLRTRFIDQDGVGFQVVETIGDWPLPVADLTGAKDPEVELRRRIVREIKTPFDLNSATLFRTQLLKLSEEDHVFVAVLHHIITDGWSMGVLAQEVVALYGAFSEGRSSPLPALPIQYGDFSVWQKQTLAGEVLDQQMAFWKQQLTGVSHLNLPLDFQRPPVQTFNGGSVHFNLSAGLTTQLNDLSRSHDATLFMTLLTAFKTLLHRYTGQEDLCVGTPVANRNREELEPLIGLFINTLALRSQVTGQSSFSDLLSSVKESTLAAYDHQDIPFEQLVDEISPDRDMSRSPIFQVLFVLQNVPLEQKSVEQNNLSFEPVDYEVESAKFDLTLTFVEEAGQLYGTLQYNTDLYRRDTVERMVTHYENLLGSIVSAPATPIYQLSLLTEEEINQQLDTWNKTRVEYNTELGVHQYIEQQVAKTPDAIAASIDGESLTYAELNQRANRYAHYLISKGVVADDLVGVCLLRSVDMVAAMVGILKAGAGYVPFDPAFPQERLGFMIEDTRIKVLITHADLSEVMPAHEAEVLCVDQFDQQLTGFADTNPDIAFNPAQLVNVIFTSGSTGKPKGVMVPHQGIVNRILWMQEEYGLTADDRVLQKTPYSFDVSVWEFFWPLMIGARIVFAKPDGHKDPDYLVELIQSEAITTLHFVPSMLNIFVQAANIENCKSIKRVFCSGEALPYDTTQKFFARNGAELHNLYGPTEASIDVSYWECQRDSDLKIVPIGKPVANTQLYVLDPHHSLLPLGAAGELYIGGDQLARGYLNREELTANTFIPNPLSKTPSDRLYKTGDLVRFLPDGNIEYLGRTDFQVKIRGFRIELGEIEVALSEHESVAEVVVMAREDEPGDKRLAAYLVAEPNHEIEVDTLRKHLLKDLPEYMVPSAFVVLESMPLSPNGKADRKALPKPEMEASSSAEYVAPSTDIEKHVAEIWGDILGQQKVGVLDNFFELGGHSLLATQVMSRVKKRFSTNLPLKALFEGPTVQALAEKIAESESLVDDVIAPPILRVDRDQKLPVSFGQRRLWFMDQMDPGNASYNMPFASTLRGDLNLEVLEETFREIIRRHESLRTNFDNLDGEPVLTIHDEFDFKLELVDLRKSEHLLSTNLQEEAARLCYEEAFTSFDISKDLLIRAKAFQTDNDEYQLIVNIHHTVCDGWSLTVLSQEIAAIYSAYVQGQPSPLSELALQYTDYAFWQRNWLQGDVLQKQLDYWTDHLQGAPEILRLPTDRPRPPVQTFNGTIYRQEVSKELTNKLEAFSTDHNASLFMTLLAGYQLLLSRYTGEKQIVVGTPIAGRHHGQTENLIGLFLNGLVMKTDLSGNPSVKEFIERVRETTLGAFAHQDLPAEILYESLGLERNAQYAAGAQVGFNFINTKDAKTGIAVGHQAQKLPELSIEPIGLDQVFARYDISFGIEEVAGIYHLHVEYNTDLFFEETIERMVQQYLSLLEGMVAGESRGIDRLEVCSEQELMPLLDLDAELVERVQPLTSMQKSMYLSSVVTPDTLQNSLGFASHLYVNIEPELFGQAVDVAIAKQSVLRTYIKESKHAFLEEAYQVVRKDSVIEWEYKDWSDRSVSKEEVEDYVRRYIYQPYDVVNGPLFRANLVKVSDEHMVAIFAGHHILVDGVSVVAVGMEVAMIIQQLAMNIEPDKVFTQSDVFADYVTGDLENVDRSDIIQFWKEYTPPVQVLDYSVSSQTPLSFKKLHESLLLDEVHWNLIKTVTRKLRITPALYFKTLFGILLNKYCRPEEDYYIYEVLAARAKGFMTNLGCYIQQVPYFFSKEQLANDAPVETILRQARQYQKDTKNKSLLSVQQQEQLLPQGRIGFLYNYSHFIPAPQFMGKPVEVIDLTNQVQGVVEFIPKTTETSLELNLHYQEGVFESNQFLERIERLSQQILAGAEKLGDLDYLTGDEEKNKLLVELRGPTLALDTSLTIHGRFEEQVALNPGATAAVFNEERITYQALNEKSNQLAHYLIEQGIKPNDLVGLCAYRSIEFLTGILAIQKAGGAYVPMDPAYPQDRISYMLADSQVSIVLSQLRVLEQRELDTDAHCFMLDGDKEKLATYPVTNPNVGVNGQHRAYMIYTSGSTGQPKGAVIRHDGALNHIEAERLELAFDGAFNFLQSAPASSDISVWQFLGPVVCGGKTVILDEVVNTPKLFSLLKTESVHVAELVPVVLQLLLDHVKGMEAEARQLPELKWMMATGEAVPVELVNNWLGIYREIPVVNAYGPTEASDDIIQCAISAPLPDYCKSVPIGKSVANLSILILDDNLALAPYGVPGEICVSGIGVGEGYWNKADKTAEVFIDNTFDEAFGETIYRTGDLGRWMEDGTVEYLGRIDNQVQIRGFRIELGEIEAKISKFHQVKENAVIVREDAPGDKTLVAYLIPELAEVSLSELRAYLKVELPEFMVPNAFMVLDELPLTPAGKVDRKALPKPTSDRTLTSEYIAPRNEVEATLVEIWSDLLSKARVGVLDDFFELGGHSLLATQVVSRMRSAFSMEFPLRALFERTTIADIAAFIEQEKSIDDDLRAPPIVAVERTEQMPVSFGQQRLWFMEQLESGKATFNMPVALRLKGPFDIAAMSNVLTQLVIRHEVLRTRFEEVDGQPFQVIDAPTAQNIPVEDLSHLDPEEKERTVMARARDHQNQPFDLTQSPLFKVKLLQLSAENEEPEYVFLAVVHHIISDGWSTGIFIRELAALYFASVQGLPAALPELKLQYADFAHWQRNWLQGDVLSKQLDYWKEQLAEVPEMLRLPTDRPRPKVRSFRGATIPVQFSPEEVQKIQFFAKKQGLTSFMVLMAGYQLLLAKYSGQNDVCVGVPLAGRNYQEVENLIGFFVNALLVRTKLDGNPTGTELFDRVKQSVLGAYAHQDVPSEMIVEMLQQDRQLSHQPGAQVGFTMMSVPKGQAAQATPQTQDLSQLHVEQIELSAEIAKNDFSLALMESEKGITGEVEYDLDLFDAATIEIMIAHFKLGLLAIIDEPEQPIASINYLSGEALVPALGLDESVYEKAIPMTAMQHDMYMDSLMNPNTLQSSHGWAIHIHRDLDVELWQKCLQEFANEQPMLRSRFVACEKPYGDVAYIALRKPEAITFKYEDLSSQNLNESQVLSITNKMIYHPYDVVRDELVKFAVLKIADEHFVVVTEVHHAILDGGSLNSLWVEVTARYEAYLQNEVHQFFNDNFIDFVQHDRQVMDTAAVRGFWQERFAPVEPLDVRLPSPLPEPAHFITKTRFLSSEHLTAVKKYCRKQKITTALYFKVLYGLLIDAYCRPDADFAIQETMGGRTKDYRSTLGCFIQEIPFIFEKENFLPGKTMSDAIASAKAFQKAIKNQRLISIGAQVELAPRGRIGFMYNYYEFLAHGEFLGEELSPQGTPSDPAGNVQFVVTLVGGQLKFDLFYHQHLFSDFDFLARLESLSQQIVEEGVEAVDQLSWVSGDEEVKQLADWNNTDISFDLSAAIPDRFEQQVAATPYATAVVFNEIRLTYAEVNARANQVAHELVALKVASGDLVGLCAERSADFLVGILGIMKAGTAYVPMDPKYPDDRLAYMRDDSQVKVMLTQNDLLPRIAKDGVITLCLDDASASFYSNEKANLGRSIAATDRAYMIYTSGTTGLPKGAIIRHNGAVNHIEAERSFLNFDGGFDFLQTAPSSSDISVWQFLGPVICGGKTVVLDEVSNAEKLFDLVQSEDVTVVELVPVVLQLLIDHVHEMAPAQRALPNLKWMMATGEAVPVELVNRWLALYPEIPVVNAYGPTEAADDVIQAIIDKPLTSQEASVPIGKPLANLQVHILDDQLRRVPIGVAGEICISGIGVGEGYWQKPDKTAEAFVVNPHSEADELLYRTGDLGRWLEDGSVEYLDRVDNQVKIRGFRIELGEIDSVIDRFEEVKETISIVRDDLPNGRAIVSYVVAEQQGFDALQLRQALKEKLPDYMVPSAIVELQKMPQTPAGKIDRKALPAPESDQATVEYVAPRNDVEETVADIWSDVMQIDRIGALDHFFDLGGHSILATKVAARLRKAFDVDLPLRTLFETPTVEGVARAVVKLQGQAALSASLPPLEVVERDEEGMPLSFAQQRLWVLEKLDPGKATYNLPAALRVKGSLDLSALERAVNTVIERHEMLRCYFVDAGDQALQKVLPFEPLAIEVEDLTALAASSTEKAEEEVAGLVAVDALKSFDLGRAPLFCYKVYQLNDEDHVLFINMHHIISDGWSNGILMKEIAISYANEKVGLSIELPELPVQYTDFAHWQRGWLQGEALDAQINYWKQQLTGTSTLELPTDFPRPAVQQYDGATSGFQLSQELTEKLKRYSQDRGVTLFMTLLAAYNVLLSRYSGQKDICVGTPIANRNLAELEQVIGLFVNTVAIRSDLEGNPSFDDLLKRVETKSLEAFEHQDLPFEKLLEELQVPRNLSTTPIFQTFFVMQGNDTGAGQNSELLQQEFGGLQMSAMNSSTQTAKFDLSLTLTDLGEGMSAAFEYRTDLFLPETIATMGRHFERLLELLMSNPEQSIQTIEFLFEDEKQTQLYDWNDTEQADYPLERSIQSFFEEQVTLRPEAVAVVADNGVLTYYQLNQAANRLAHYLIEQGIGEDKAVGLCLHRSQEMMIALMAVEKAGGAYVPFDPSFPEDRLAYMLEDTDVSLLLTQSHLKQLIPATQASVICLDGEEGKAILGDASSYAATNPNVAFNPRQLFNIIYTSGSTGKPKGVMVPQQGIVNRIWWMQQEYQLTPEDKVLQKTPYSFDVSVWEFFWPMMVGAQLVFAKPEGHKDPDYLVEMIQQHGITTMHFVPSMLTMFLHAKNIEGCTSLRRVFCSGEALPYDTQQRFFARNQSELHNLYGPTEASVDVSYWACERDSDMAIVPIGKPVANTQLYVLDENHRLLPRGAAGELYLGGVQLARGYLNREEQTANTFIPNPLAGTPGDRLYKTGDLVRYMADGYIEYLGRTDHQVKIRGLRIELGEIEVALGKHPAVSEVVVMAREDRPGDKRLAAYLVLHEGESVTSKELRQYLSVDLPDYMVPAAYVVLDEMPLSGNGKADRKALPAPDQSLIESSEVYVAPRNETETALAEIWQSLLGVDRVGVNDNFFELGGHSLIAVRVVNQLSEQLGVKLALADLFSAQTVATLSEFIAQKSDDTQWQSLVALNGRGASTPLFLIHPIGGEVMCYADLAHALGPKQRVYGLQAYGLQEGQTPVLTVTEMAQRYVAEIQSVQPNGPYQVGGQSLGGVLAIEVANQLRQLGEEIKFVALFDTYTPEAMMKASGDEWDYLSLALGGNVPLPKEKLAAMDDAERAAFVYELGRAAGLIPSDVSLQQISQLYHLAKANHQAVADYQLPEISWPIAHFSALDHGDLEQSDVHWQALEIKGDYQSLEGQHESIIRKPFVSKLAKQLEEKL